MREHIKAFLLASSLAFGIPTFVEADPLERSPSGPQEMRAMRWLRKLDLTEAQRDRIFQIFHDQAPATREQMKRVHRAREALRQAESDMALLRAETLSRVAAVLSPEQREKLALFQSQLNALRDFTLG
jgi:Spy/CpxP family protein refolding chaperone